MAGSEERREAGRASGSAAHERAIEHRRYRGSSDARVAAAPGRVVNAPKACTRFAFDIRLPNLAGFDPRLVHERTHAGLPGDGGPDLMRRADMALPVA